MRYVESENGQTLIFGGLAGRALRNSGLGLSWAASAMQGWRVGMEDAHIALQEAQARARICHNIEPLSSQRSF